MDGTSGEALEKDAPTLFIASSYFHCKGPKQSIPVEKKAGLNSCSLAWGRSAIRGTTGLALHFWQSKQECCCFLTAALPRRIQYRRRSSAKTRSEPGWQSWWSISWIRSCVTLWAGSRTTGWIVSGSSWSLRRSRPPTRMSWNTESYSGARVIKRLDDGTVLPIARQSKSSGKLSCWDFLRRSASANL